MIMIHKCRSVCILQAHYPKYDTDNLKHHPLFTPTCQYELSNSVSAWRGSRLRPCRWIMSVGSLMSNADLLRQVTQLDKLFVNFLCTINMGYHS